MNKTVLIVATSASMLAKMANNSGYYVLVIDLFADLDTRQYAVEVKQVNSLSLYDIKPAVNYFLEKHQVSQFVYGSGLECHFSSLEFLAEKMLVLGNSVKVFRRLLEKHEFFDHLKSQDIGFPEVSFSKPKNACDWLSKPLKGSGGINVRRCKQDRSDADIFYWQRYVDGMPMSVLFMADGSNAEAIGFNRQLTVTGPDQQAFIFSGVLTQRQVPEKSRKSIIGWVQQLTQVYGLRGINSLDFILTPEQSYVLEINPRPSASMILYDANLFALHVKASKGELQTINLDKHKQLAYQIIFAQKQISIPRQMHWPEWSMDQPVANAKINSGQPICSIIAAGCDQDMALKKLQSRATYITTKLKG